jgi:hypothetical protein
VHLGRGHVSSGHPALIPAPPIPRCSLFFHSLKFKDVHRLSVAGRGEEHTVHAEGQRADAHTPGDRGQRVRLAATAFPEGELAAHPWDCVVEELFPATSREPSV